MFVEESGHGPVLTVAEGQALTIFGSESLCWIVWMASLCFCCSLHITSLGIRTHRKPQQNSHLTQSHLTQTTNHTPDQSQIQSGAVRPIQISFTQKDLNQTSDGKGAEMCHFLCYICYLPGCQTDRNMSSLCLVLLMCLVVFSVCNYVFCIYAAAGLGQEILHLNGLLVK